MHVYDACVNCVNTCASMLPGTALLVCSERQAPRLWMDSGSHNLLDEFLDITSQLFEQGQHGNAAEVVEQSLQTQLMSNVSNAWCTVCVCLRKQCQM